MASRFACYGILVAVSIERASGLRSALVSEAQQQGGTDKEGDVAVGGETPAVNSWCFLPLWLCSWRCGSAAVALPGPPVNAATEAAGQQPFLHEGGLLLYVRMPDGAKIAVDVPRDATASDVKIAVGHRVTWIRIQPEWYAIFHRGERVENETVHLSDIGVSAESELELRFQRKLNNEQTNFQEIYYFI